MRRAIFERTLSALGVGAVALAFGAFGCARDNSSQVLSPASSRHETTGASVVCEALRGRFVGLPAELESAPAATTDSEKSAAGASRAAEYAPLAGRWWVQNCEFGGAGNEVRVHLVGPAWYWVERDEPPFHMRQHVYFRVDAQLYGQIEPSIGLKNGIVSVWFKPTHSKIDVEPLGDVHPTTDNVVVSVLRVLATPLPPLNVDARAKKRVENEVTEKFESALGRGYTVSYDIGRGQADFALGRLAPGKVPEHPFEDDGRPWFVNERLLAAPGGVHVLGPFDPNLDIAIDAGVTNGSGIVWRAVCAPELEHAFSAVEHGEEAEVPRTQTLAAGSLSGSKLHETTVAAQKCSFYLVVSPLGTGVSQAIVRVRPA